MKYVYVLVSSLKDLYYEQALMSTYSLRYHNKDAEIILLVDNKTFDSLKDRTSNIKDYVNEIIKVDYEDSVPNVDRSRLIKTSIPEYVKDDFLYIDCDTIICEDLSEINNVSYSTAGVLDGHVELQDHIHRKYFLKRDKKLGFSGTKSLNGNINGGLVLCRNNSEGKELFKQWNEMWKYSAYTKHDKHDQSALNQANYLTGLKMGLLDGKWNCQPSHGGLEYLGKAKIIHYYSSEFSGKNYVPYYKLADKQLQTIIKEKGLTSEIKEMINEPRFQFNKVHIINDNRILNIMQSPLTFTLADIYAHLPVLFNIMEAFVGSIRSIGKKIKR